MVSHYTDLVAELRDSGVGLWSSVECDVRPHGFVVYARLDTHPHVDVARALTESERLIKSVLTRRLERSEAWVVAVQWSERLCKTFTAPDQASLPEPP
jgi:hypothetical protein